MIRFIHAADTHLDSPLRGLERYEGAPVGEIRSATRRALENLVRVAIDRKVQFVLIAGDVYDGDWRDHNTGLFFANQMSELRRADIPVYLIAGNHDAANHMTKRLRLPPNVHTFLTDTAETIVPIDSGVAIHGQGFATRAVMDDLSRHYPKPKPGCFNIGLLHTSVEGYEGHDPYAPCTLGALKGLGYDYWALGHVHTRRELSQDPPIWFPGNIQGRHIRETGPKGCLVVTANEGEKPVVEFEALDVVRWGCVIIDAAAFESIDDGLDAVKAKLIGAIDSAEGRLLAVRVVIQGATPAHELILAESTQFANEVRQLANDVGGGRLWIEKVKLATRPTRAVDAATLDGPMAELLRVIDELSSDEGIDLLAEAIRPMTERLPRELTSGAADSLVSTENLRAMLVEAYPILAQRLRSHGEPA